MLKRIVALEEKSTVVSRENEALKEEVAKLREENAVFKSERRESDLQARHDLIRLAAQVDYLVASLRQVPVTVPPPPPPTASSEPEITKSPERATEATARRLDLSGDSNHSSNAAAVRAPPLSPPVELRWQQKA